jgi:hypothetical protein
VAGRHSACLWKLAAARSCVGRLLEESALQNYFLIVSLQPALKHIDCAGWKSKKQQHPQHTAHLASSVSMYSGARSLLCRSKTHVVPADKESRATASADI